MRCASWLEQSSSPGRDARICLNKTDRQTERKKERKTPHQDMAHSHPHSERVASSHEPLQRQRVQAGRSSRCLAGRAHITTIKLTRQPCSITCPLPAQARAREAEALSSFCRHNLPSPLTACSGTCGRMSSRCGAGGKSRPSPGQSRWARWRRWQPATAAGAGGAGHEGGRARAPLPLRAAAPKRHSSATCKLASAAPLAVTSSLDDCTSPEEKKRPKQIPHLRCARPKVALYAHPHLRWAD